MWRSDHDIFQTFEGDNTVLLQQVKLPGLVQVMLAGIAETLDVVPSHLPCCSLLFAARCSPSC